MEIERMDAAAEASSGKKLRKAEDEVVGRSEDLLSYPRSRTDLAAAGKVEIERMDAAAEASSGKMLGHQEMKVELGKGHVEGYLELEAAVMKAEEEDEDELSEEDLEDLRNAWKYEYRTEEERMDEFRNAFKKYWADRVSYYDDLSTVSSMVGTFKPMSGAWPCTSLQFYSIQLLRIEETVLTWPVEVYGIVAVRDQVDRNRNIIFQRKRDHCQTLTQKDSFLELTGPCRAIKFLGDPIYIEIQLKVKKKGSAGTCESSEDEALISEVFDYNERSRRLCTRANRLCEIKLNVKPLDRTVQATIVGIRVVADDDVDGSGSWPCQHGGRVVARTSSRNAEFVLLDSQTLPLQQQQDSEGYLDLLRRVVSVEIDGHLIISLEAYSLVSCGDHDKGELLAVGTAVFRPKKSGISQATCHVSASAVSKRSWNVEIIVAWSLIAPTSRMVDLW